MGIKDVGDAINHKRRGLTEVMQTVYHSACDRNHKPIVRLAAFYNQLKIACCLHVAGICLGSVDISNPIKDQACIRSPD